MIGIVVTEDMDINKAIKKFRRKVVRSGVLRQYKYKSRYMKPSELRKIKKNKMKHLKKIEKLKRERYKKK